MSELPPLVAEDQSVERGAADCVSADDKFLSLIDPHLLPSAGAFAGLILNEGDGLIYAARTRSGFTPKLRTELMKKFKPLETGDCPFANLPEAKSGRWGAGLTAAKMEDCRWLQPVLVGQFEFVEWTPDNHLRHSKFIGLREDKRATDVVREK